MRRGWIPALVVLAVACSPGRDDATVLDAGRDGGGETGCDRADCEARCRAAGFETGTCRANGSCACAGSGCVEAECDERCVAAGFAGGECRSTGACGCTAGDAGATGSTGERCDDGRDNNGNGAVDEGCGCEPGSAQPCWTGSAATRNAGVCRDGTQSCIGDGEFSHWGPCEGARLPDPVESCDGLDNDCDRAVDEDCPGACVVGEFGVETSCEDWRDNDCDTVADCFDPDCPPCCREELCDDGLDNNCDGLIDEFCEEPCAPSESAAWGNCGDGLDNDCDTRSDCLDVECLPSCCGEELCGDGSDNDCDGRIDCDDPQCCTQPACRTTALCSGVCCLPGATRYCDTPTYCSWGIQQCRPDGRWGACAETGAPTGCSGYFYNPACCLSLVACCQNYGHDRSLPVDASIGDCDGVTAPCP